MTDQRIVLVGAGVMGEALGTGIMQQWQPTPSLVIVEADPDRAARVASELGGTTADLADALREPATVILAVKPQHVDELLPQIAAVIHPESLIISVAAGVRTDRIERAIPGRSVIRAMPNTPARVQAGVTGLAAGAECSAEAMTLATGLLRCVGDVVTIPEEQMDALTAISGSGPAYVFYLAEAMLAAAADFGLDDEVAQLLVSRTIAGAAALMTSGDISPTQLRLNVTSPGGTTQAAITSLDGAHVSQLLQDAITAARDRSEELS